jgi:hypothetical protein
MSNIGEQLAVWMEITEKRIQNLIDFIHAIDKRLRKLEEEQ